MSEPYPVQPSSHEAARQFTWDALAEQAQAGQLGLPPAAEASENWWDKVGSIQPATNPEPSAQSRDFSWKQQADALGLEPVAQPVSESAGESEAEQPWLVQATQTSPKATDAKAGVDSSGNAFDWTKWQQEGGTQRVNGADGREMWREPKLTRERYHKQTVLAGAYGKIALLEQTEGPLKEWQKDSIVNSALRQRVEDENTFYTDNQGDASVDNSAEAMRRRR